MAGENRERRASADSVYTELRSRFASAQYAAGDRLTEQALAAELGVSRTPVREALGRLLGDGLVRYASRGVEVSALDEKERTDLFALRAVLESFAAAQAADRQAGGFLAPVALTRMEEAADNVRAAVQEGDRRRAATANMHLHREIARAADNAFLFDTLTRVWDRVAVATIANLDDDEWLSAIPEQHSRVTEAIRSGDAEGARSAMAHHIHDAERRSATTEQHATAR